MTDCNDCKVLFQDIKDSAETGLELIELGNTNPPTEPPEPSLPFVTVRDKTPLMEVSHYDRKDKAVLRLYKYGTLKTGRIRAKAGKKLYYDDMVPTAQGVAVVLSPDQNVDGFELTIGTRTIQNIPGTRNPKQYEKRFHILKSKVLV